MTERVPSPSGMAEFRRFLDLARLVQQVIHRADRSLEWIKKGF
jgi:hypothetical protein